MRRTVVIGLILLLAVLPPAFGQARFKRGTLTITQGAKRVVLLVEVADTPASRAQGLMFRTRLDELAGMLFLFEEESAWGFWMKNTLIPLTIGYFDAKWQLVDTKDMKVALDPQNGPFEIYNSAKPFKYALEVNQCFFKRHGLGAGAVAALAFAQGSAPPRTTPQTSAAAATPPTCVGK